VGEIDGVGEYVLWLAIGTLLVGFSEDKPVAAGGPLQFVAIVVGNIAS
jgi:hypothetical protein